MVQYIEKYKRNIAIDMRKKGMSYSEIQNRINIPKSTLSFWLKKIILTDEQENNLNRRISEALKKSLETKRNKKQKLIEDIKISSEQDIKEISKKEFWLMGIILYWRERLLSGIESDIKKGVSFTTSDPDLARLFLKWLMDIGGIKNDEILPDIFIDSKTKSRGSAIKYWSEIIERPISDFVRVYSYKDRSSQKNGVKNRNMGVKSKNGLLRIRVRSSSALARQISGWINGIIKYYWA